MKQQCELGMVLAEEHSAKDERRVLDGEYYHL